MDWRTEWKTISDRISGFSAAGQIFIQFWSQRSSDTYGTIKKELLPHSQSIFKSIEKFLKISESQLPSTAIDCCKKFLEDNKELFFMTNPGDFPRLQAVLTNIVLFQTEFTYQISDTSFILKRLVERSFIHLNRSIIADIDIRTKWKKAFKDGELSCEKLGAIHLLQHGIWAFKASAEGERTDLILRQPLKDLYEVENTADALVLTEWKLIREREEIRTKSEQALRQARIYSASILGGFELITYRYLILVSKKKLEMPQDIHENNVIYRYINIAVDPSTPSKK